VARILVVDDEPDLVEACTLALEDAGYAVATVTQPKDALARARQDRPDLVVLDWVMPGCDGGVVLAQLRADQNTAATPVLVISALADGAPRARSADANGFLAKPFDAEQLVHEIGVMLGSRHGEGPSGTRRPR